MIKLIIVDDEPLALEDFSELLCWGNYGYELCGCAANGVKALELIEKKKPDIVFTDISMPIMDGIELCKNISEKYPGIKMVILTAYREFEYARKAMAYGVTDYLLKNQINEQTVLKLLVRISKTLEKERAREDSTRQSYYQNMMLNMAQIYSQSGVSENNPCYCMMLLQRVPWLPEQVLGRGPKEILLNREALAALIPPQKDMALQQVIWLDKKSWGLILVPEAEESFSFKAYKPFLQEFSFGLQNYFKEKYSTDILILFDETMTRLSCLREHFSSMQACGEYELFISHNLVIPYRNYVDMYANTEGDHKKQRMYFQEIDEALQQGDKDGLLEKMNELKAVIFGSKYDIGQFSYISRHLLEILDYQRIQNGFSPLREYFATFPLSWMDATAVWSFLEREAMQIAELSSFQKSEHMDKRIQLAVLYIHHHYKDKLTVKSVGEQVGLSEMYFNMLFKNEMGMTMGDYLTKYRIEVAKRLILEGRHKVYEVADLTGYTSAQYFSQIFLKLTGCTPKEYEKNAKRNQDYENE